MSLLLTGLLFCSMSVADIKQTAKHETMNTTAYTADYADTGKRKGDPAYNITSSGKEASRGVTIAAAKDIPFGTKVYIPYFDGLEGWNNHGIFEVQDRGGAITKGHIDVYMTNEQEMNRFGRRNLDVYILGRCDTVSQKSELPGDDQNKNKKDEEQKQDNVSSPNNDYVPIVPLPETQKNRVAQYDKYKSLLMALCTVCNTPLGFPRDLEKDLLICDTFDCPNCRQRNKITKELKQFIMYF